MAHLKFIIVAKTKYSVGSLFVIFVIYVIHLVVELVFCISLTEMKIAG